MRPSLFTFLQQPRDWGSFNFSESGGGGGHSYYLLALRLLDYMGFAMEASTEWMLEGGGTHSSSTALRLGICAPPPPPQHILIFRVFLFRAGRGYPGQPDYRRFKIPSFTSPGHTHSLVCAPRATFSLSRAAMSYK